MGKETIYEVFCEGHYYSNIDNKKATKRYEISFKANDKIKKTGFLSAFRHSLLSAEGEDTAISKAMKAKYPDYKRFKTHRVVGVINLTDENAPVKELALMNRNQVINFINRKGYPIDCDLYPSVSDIRQALRDYRESADAFSIQQEKLRATRGTRLSVIESLERLNAPALTNTSTQEQTSQKYQRDNMDDDDIELIPDLDDEDELNELLDGI